MNEEGEECNGVRWMPGGEFEEAIHELRRSSHALTEAVEELLRYSEHGDYPELHFQKGLSAIELAEQRLSVAKRKLGSSR
jgi:hypothetical protein